MTRRTLLALLWLPLAALAQPAEMAPLTPRDFAYGIPLEVDGDGALYSFDLPAEVYRATSRRDLGDLRIFNGHNEVVPHLLRAGVPQREVEGEPVALRFFPLYGPSEDGEGDTQVHIATDSSGAVVDFWQRAPSGEKETVRRYLIDASALEQPVEKLLLQWDETAGGFLVEVTLEYSSDLNTWQRLGESQTLAALSYQGYRLGQRAIALPALQARYYRLSWPLGEQGIELRGVQATLQRVGEEAPRHWLSLQPGGDETHRGVYDFSSGGHFPVDRLRLQLPQPNTVVRAKLLSRAKEGETPWRLRHQGLFYTLQREGHTLRSDTVSLPAVDDPFWRLEIEMGGGGIGRGSPQLELGWVSHRVYFVSRGETPFSLAFGAAGVEPLRSDLAPLLHTLEQRRQGNGFIKPALPGGMHELGGESRLQPPPPPLPWRTWLLWAVLVIGVLVLALMARSLYRQMHDADRID
jgi:hypothetical protein